MASSGCGTPGQRQETSLASWRSDDLRRARTIIAGRPRLGTESRRGWGSPFLGWLLRVPAKWPGPRRTPKKTQKLSIKGVCQEYICREGSPERDPGSVFQGE